MRNGEKLLHPSNFSPFLINYNQSNAPLSQSSHTNPPSPTSVQSGSKNKDESTDEQYDQSVKNKILSASLPFVSDLGWSKEALIKGAETIGYPGVTHGLFPRGGADLVYYFYADCNTKLAAKLQKDTEAKTEIIPVKYINNAVENRLRMIVPYKNRWPQAIALMSLPPNVRLTLENLKTLADDICYYAGDRSVDVNMYHNQSWASYLEKFKWYARRFAVAGLYKTTELYMMQDQSEDHKKTWDFLNRRVEELIQIHEVLNKTESITDKSPDIFSSAFTTMRNILRA